MRKKKEKPIFISNKLDELEKEYLLYLLNKAIDTAHYSGNSYIISNSFGGCSHMTQSGTSSPAKTPYNRAITNCIKHLTSNDQQ